VTQISQESVSQSIDAMVKADPKLAWLKEVEQRGDVDWRQVKEIHDSFKYANSGMGPAAQLVVAIMVAAVMGPAGFGLSGMPLALATSVGTNAATSAINNKGDLGTVFKDVTSSDAIKGYAVSGIMAGFVPAIDPANAGFNLDTLTTVSQHVAAEATLKTAIMGGSLKDNLGSAALGAGIAIGGAQVAGKIGDSTLFQDGKITKVAMHAALDGLMAEALGGDFRTGALAAGANEALVKYLGDKLLPAGVDPNSEEYKAGVSKPLTASQLIGALTAAATGGDASAAAEVAANGTQYNYLKHAQLVNAAKELTGCKADECGTIVEKYAELSRDQTIEAVTACMANAAQCGPASKEVANTAANLDQIYGSLDDSSKDARASLQLLINENMDFQPILAMATAGATANALADAVQAKFNLTPEETRAVAQLIAGGLGVAGGALGFKQVLKAASDRRQNGGPKGIDKIFETGRAP
jgi:filamentous hemagglutinin